MPRHQTIKVLISSNSSSKSTNTIGDQLFRLAIRSWLLRLAAVATLGMNRRPWRWDCISQQAPHCSQPVHRHIFM